MITILATVAVGIGFLGWFATMGVLPPPAWGPGSAAAQAPLLSLPFLSFWFILRLAVVTFSLFSMFKFRRQRGNVLRIVSGFWLRFWRFFFPDLSQEAPPPPPPAAAAKHLLERLAALPDGGLQARDIIADFNEFLDLAARIIDLPRQEAETAASYLDRLRGRLGLATPVPDPVAGTFEAALYGKKTIPHDEAIAFRDALRALLGRAMRPV